MKINESNHQWQCRRNGSANGGGIAEESYQYLNR
jgi:hypothetical protein